jgi:hypothetical protein
MHYSIDRDLPVRIIHLINDAIHPDPDPIAALADDLLAATWPRLVGQGPDGFLNPGSVGL